MASQTSTSPSKPVQALKMCIRDRIQDGTFFENPALLKAIENVKANNSALHLYGLLSYGGVHSHNIHMYGLLELAKRHGFCLLYTSRKHTL